MTGIRWQPRQEYSEYSPHMSSCGPLALSREHSCIRSQHRVRERDGGVDREIPRLCPFSDPLRSPHRFVVDVAPSDHRRRSLALLCFLSPFCSFAVLLYTCLRLGFFCHLFLSFALLFALFFRFHLVFLRPPPLSAFPPRQATKEVEGLLV